MSTRNNETGSTHVVIIVVLIAVILGLLGFVFWQNFIQKKDTTPSASTTTTTSKAVTETTPATTMTSLAIGNYGVEVPYDSTTDTYTLIPATSGGFAGGYTVYSKKVTEACGASVNIGVIKRFNKGDSIPTPSNNVSVGNYEYVLGVGGYGNCSTDAGMSILDTATAAFASAFNNLKASH